MPENAPADEGKDGIMDHWFRISDVAELWTFATTVGRYRGGQLLTNLQLLHRFADRVLEIHVNDYNQAQKVLADSRLILNNDRRLMRDQLSHQIASLWYAIARTRDKTSLAETLTAFCRQLNNHHKLVHDSGEYIAFVLAEANIKHEPAPEEG